MQLAHTLVRISARLLFALGLVCLLLGGWLGWQTLSYARDAIPVTGEVVSYQEVRDGGNTSYRPRIRFVTVTGSIVTFSGQLAWTSQRFAVGTRLPVMYQAEDPMKARLARFTDNWLGPAVSVVIGLVALAAGVLFRRQSRRAG
jgi:hypothetical protein